ncbi:hypothetical protein HDU98_009200, partial [Podochytrium sp. JEL0797]
MMEKIAGLVKELKQLPGMTPLSRALPGVIKPLLLAARNPSLAETDDLAAMFELEAHQITAMVFDHSASIAGLDESVVMANNKMAQDGEVDNFQTYYYCSRIYIRYRPKTKLFDLFFAYTYIRNGSIFQ